MTTYFGRQASKGLKLDQKPGRSGSTTDRYRSATDRFRSTTYGSDLQLTGFRSITDRFWSKIDESPIHNLQDSDQQLTDSDQ
jgi:hypothetical protein